MTIDDKSVVSMTYILREDNADGQLIQQVKEDRPFVYLFGVAGLLPAFKANIKGLKAGDDFAFLLDKEDAYGLPSEDNVLQLDKKIFEIDGTFDAENIKPGEVVPMEDENGYPLSGKIVEVGADSVMVDFNHPLAGMNLHFSGKILEVREATDEEMSHGHVHGPEGHHHHH